MLAIASCATSSSTTESHGYHLPDSDIRSIKRLVAQEVGIRKPIHSVRADSPDYAVVESGPGLQAGDDIDYFVVRKVAGRWNIVPPIYEVVITAPTH